jgi:hypothetical protein
MLFAAETITEHSKTAFYIAGALLVVFALALSAVGLRSETFPPTKGARVLVSLVAVVLVAAAMTTAVLTA